MVENKPEAPETTVDPDLDPEEVRRNTGLYQDAYVRLGTLGIRNVADLGCGVGRFVKIMIQRGMKPQMYWGLDNNRSKIQQARKEYPGWRFTFGDMFSARAKQEFMKYDAFLMIELLDHIEKDIELIKSIPVGKKLVLYMPQFEGPGNIRWFESSEEAKSRYSHFIDISSKGRYRSPEGYVWTTLLGTRK